MNAVLTLQNISKSYSHTSVLRDCSMEIFPGEAIAIVGENGSGKSTLLKIIVGMLKADGGTIHRQGAMGYCPQEMIIYERLTVWENLVYFGTAYGLSSTSIAQFGQVYLKQLHFASYRDHVVATLSGGTKQKLNLTLALLHNPDLLILDEPYQGFDYETYLTFLQLMSELKDNRKSVLVVTHIASDNHRFDRVLKLVKGRISDR